MASPDLSVTAAPPATALLTIDGVTASQIIGSSAPQPIASGLLSLLPGPGSTTNAANTEPLLLIKVDTAVFPLFKDTIMGTHDGKEEWYTFSLPLREEASTSSAVAETKDKEQTWVRLVLPPLTNSDLVSLRDRFEEHLITRGLLYDGIRATGDELGRSSAQSGSSTATSIHQSAAQHTVTTDPTDQPWQFSRWSHNLSNGFKGSTETVAGYTTSASNAISGLAASAGQVAGNAFAKAKEGLSSATREDIEGNQTTKSQEATTGDERVMPNTRDAMYDAFQGAGSGLSDITSSLTTEAPHVVKHNAGEEASKIAGETAQGVKNVGKAGLDATLGTSTMYHGVEAAKGAVQSQDQKGAE